MCLGAFSGAIAADDADGMAAWDVEADVAECPELAVELSAAAEEGLLEAVLWSGVEVVALAEGADGDGEIVGVIR